MKKDLEKIRSILQKIEECPEPFISFMELENGNPDEFVDDPDFVTAYSLIMDGQLICNRNGETSKNLGLIIYSPKANSYQNSYIRLTDDGHAFLAALKNESFLSQIREKVPALAISTIVELGKQWLLNKMAIL